MDASFRAAATFFRRAPLQLDHKTTVVRLYRHCLKAVVSWGVDRDIVNEEATRIRGLFDENRQASGPESTRLIREANEQLAQYTHPDKYVVPYMPGGSKFMRNAPPPLEVRAPPKSTKILHSCRICSWASISCIVATVRSLNICVFHFAQAVFPNGIPEDIKQNEQPVHPDQVPYRFRPENDPILIDAMAKSMV